MNLFKDEKEEYIDHDFLDVNFSGLCLVKKVFEDCEFNNCDFTETIFENCKFVDCVFTNCNLSLAKLKNSSLLNVSFSTSKLVGINWAEAKWPVINISVPLDFFECILDHSSFFGLNMQGFKCYKCQAKGVDFREADLSSSDMRHTDFSEAIFASTNLSRANFSHAYNYLIDTQINKVKEARFTMPEVVGLLSGLDVVIVE